MTERKFSKNITNVSSVKTNQSELTPPKKASKSPISYSKCSHQSSSKQTVSYGELQMVLDNIQVIKQKASTQVKQLNEENSHLREQIVQMQNCIQKLTGSIKEQAETIKQQAETIKEFSEKRKNEEQKWKVKCQQLEGDNRSKVRRLQEKDISINLLNMKVSQLQSHLAREKDISASTSKDLEELNKKWNWAFDILAGDHNRAEELVWKVKDKNCCLWDLFSKITSLETAIDLKTQKIDSITEQLAQCKNQYRKTSQMLDKSLNELNFINDKLAKAEQQLKQHYISTLALKDDKSSLESRIQWLLRQNAGLKAAIDNLEHKTHSISEELTHRDYEAAKKEKLIQFTSLLNEVCDQSQDYGKVLDRLHYLQRFRKEHYFNVQKIQYLCKLLDN